ncbi:MAG: 2-oxo acid dehydrogenase subunit E2 [Polyangiales bacterium]
MHDNRSEMRVRAHIVLLVLILLMVTVFTLRASAASTHAFGGLMPWFHRPDGDVVPALSPLRRIMPYLMRGRNESAVYYEQSLDLSYTLSFIREWNRAHAVPLTVFDLIVAGCGRVLHARPGLNRFVSGGRIYQRRGVDVSFAAKQSFADDAPLVTVKLPVAQGESLVDTHEHIHTQLAAARSGAERGVDHEVRWLTWLPGPVLRAAVTLADTLDAANLLPFALSQNDPMYASVFLANLGSIGLDGAFHHLYEHGTASLFGVVGTVKKVATLNADGTTRVHDGVSIRWTFDERIHDGFYCAATLEMLRRWVEKPSALGIDESVGHAA